MDDAEFLRRMRQRLQESAGIPVNLELSEEERSRVAVDFYQPIPRVVMGADALKYPGMARMFMQYAMLCLRERREVPQREFLLFLRRN